MGLLMYRPASPSSAQAPKRDSTAIARSPIRRAAPGQTLLPQRGQNPPVLPSSSSTSITGRRRRAIRPSYEAPSHLNVVPTPPPEAERRPLPWILEQRPAAPGNGYANPTPGQGYRQTPPSQHPRPIETAPARNVATSAEPTRRMQVTRQRPTRRANLEAEMSRMGRFVVRPIASEDLPTASSPRGDRARSPTVDPMELLVISGSSSGSRRRNRLSSNTAYARSRSPQRVAVAPRITAPDETDGLGDRHRSPSVEESDWDTLRATIQPDEQLPSASSSFTSTSASTASLEQSASQQSTSTSRTSSTLDRSYVLPTEEHLDITDAQLECGVICDDARDARPPFPPSEGPSRRATREPSDQHSSARNPDDLDRSLRIWDAVLNPSPWYRGEMSARDWLLEGHRQDDTDSLMADHLRSPSPITNPDLTASATSAGGEASLEPRRPILRTSGAIDLTEALRLSRTVLPNPPPVPSSRTPAPADAPPEDASIPLQSPSSEHAPPPMIDMLASSSTSPTTAAVGAAVSDASSASAVSSRLAEVQMQWQQLRRINELLQCGREVPGWLWEVAGLAPELGAREFEI